MKTEIEDIRCETVQEDEMPGNDAVVIANLIARWILSRFEERDDTVMDSGGSTERGVKELP